MQGIRYELHTMLTAGAAPRLGLVIPFESPVARHANSNAAYYLVYPTEFSHGKPLDAFPGWLLEQAADYAGVPQ